MHATLEKFETIFFFFSREHRFFFCRGLRTYWRDCSCSSRLLQSSKEEKTGVPGTRVACTGLPSFLLWAPPFILLLMRMFAQQVYKFQGSFAAPILTKRSMVYRRSGKEKEFYSGAATPGGYVRGEFLLPLGFLYRGSKMKKQELRTTKN